MNPNVNAIRACYDQENNHLGDQSAHMARKYTMPGVCTPWGQGM